MANQESLNKDTFVAECLKMKKGEVRNIYLSGFSSPREIVPILDIEVNPIRKKCGMEPIYGVSGIQNEPEKFRIWCGFF